MPTPTYDLIEEKVLGSAAASVTFSSIPGTYKDLVLELWVASVGTNQNVAMTLNSDNSALYSKTWITGSGSAAASNRQTGLTFLNLEADAYPRTNSYALEYVNLMSYANANVFKTVLVRTGNAGNAVEAMVGLYRSTNAITTIKLETVSTTMASGSYFRLWGVSG